MEIQNRLNKKWKQKNHRENKIQIISFSKQTFYETKNKSWKGKELFHKQVFSMSMFIEPGMKRRNLSFKI